MSAENHIQNVEDRLKKVENISEKHSLILKGDSEKYPPEPGVMTVLKQMSDLLTHPESGNAALYHSVRTIKEQDMKRVAFIGGARWVMVALIGIASALIGMAAEGHFHLFVK